jgi:Protein of unknown function (DUF2934)
MPSKRNSTATDSREALPRPTEPGAEAQAPATRPAPTPRTSRGAATIHAPRKTELHRVSVAPRPLPSREQIAQRAYELWMQSGCSYGRDDENWLQAERELSAGC